MIKRLTNSALGIRALGGLGRAAIELVIASTRWSTAGSEVARALIDGPEPVIGAFWHNRLMLIGRVWPRGKPLAMVMSTHGDSRILGAAYGDRVTDPVYGSTRRNPMGALKGMLQAARRGVSVGITPDGPRGPRMRCHPGVIEAARASGLPIVPVAWSTRRRRLAQSWDRFVIALPFGDGVIVYGEPIRVPRDLDEERRETARRAVETALTEVTDEADRLMGHPPVQPAMPRHTTLDAGLAAAAADPSAEPAP